MKKIAVYVLLIVMLCFIQPTPAHAVIQLLPLWPVIASTTLHVAAAAAGLYYALKADVKGSIDAYNRITMPSKAVWIDLKAAPPVQKQKDITAKMEYAKSQELAAKKNADNTDKYPVAKKL